MKSQGGGQQDSRPRSPAQQAGSRRATVAALIAVAILVALVLWVAQSIMAHNKLQNCLDSGRRDCLPVDTGGS